MHDLDLLVPSALVDPGLAADLMRDQTCPTLARLVAHAGRREALTLAPDASLSAWQAWVFARRAGVDAAEVNVAELSALARGIAPAASGGRYLVEPAHFSIAKDHLRLDDPRDLAITLPEARALAASILPVLVDAGWRLDPADPAMPTHWLLSHVDGSPLSAPAIDRAIGDNVAAWQPRSTGAADDGAALAWRRCVNEIQMSWFEHPVNATREADGRPTINTLWLSGNGRARSALPALAAVDSGLPLLAALPIDATAPRALASFDGFLASSRAADWSGWREQLSPFDAYLATVLARQRDGAIGAVTLVLCGRDEARAWTLDRRDTARFWRRWSTPPLADVFAERDVDADVDADADAAAASSAASSAGPAAERMPR